MVGLREGTSEGSVEGILLMDGIILGRWLGSKVGTRNAAVELDRAVAHTSWSGENCI